MQISIADPVFQTYLFIGLLLAALVTTIRRRAVAGSIGIDVTQELKGFAILAVIFSHVGYFLALDHRFLFPLSVFAGVGVDLFLFVSGFGLAASASARGESLLQFYRRRLKNIYIPLWVVLAIFFVADYVLLRKTYAWDYVAHSLVGWFPSANLFSDVNSPLWYLSLILFYYLLFPLLFSKRWLPLSALGVYAVTYALSWWTPDVLRENMPLYELHFLAFPLGMFAAWLARGRKSLRAIRNDYLYYALLAALTAAIGYLAIYSGVGKGLRIEQGMNMLTVLLIVALFIVKRFEIRMLGLFGLLSFELYLLHWPLMERYDIFFRFLPASVALAAYLALFIALGWILHYIARRVDSTRF